MKKLCCFLFLLPIFSVAASQADKSASVKLKNKASQQKIFRHHESSWQQPRYDRSVRLFRCIDSWGHKLRGKFIEEQRYFIELGGGSCSRIRHRAVSDRAISGLLDHHFPADQVYYAVGQIKRKYGLHNARLILSEDIVASRNNMKYTLVFSTGRYGYREFRVKQDRWSGNIKKIREV